MILNSSSGATLLFELLVLLIMEDKDTLRVNEIIASLWQEKGEVCALCICVQQNMDIKREKFWEDQSIYSHSLHKCSPKYAVAFAFKTDVVIIAIKIKHIFIS